MARYGREWYTPREMRGHRGRRMEERWEGRPRREPEPGAHIWPYQEAYEIERRRALGYGRDMRGRDISRFDYGPEFREGPAGRDARFGRQDDEAAYERYQRFGRSAPDRWPDRGHDIEAMDFSMDDRDVREAVMENLFHDTWIEPDRIDVDVNDGVVTLTGEVRDFMEARYAWDDAWESAGVRGVINNLTVRVDRAQQAIDIPQTTGGRRSRRGSA